LPGSRKAGRSMIAEYGTRSEKSVAMRHDSISRHSGK
jgi:hypothetical protein